MALKTARFIDLLLVALTLGMTFCHALEIVGKLRLGGSEWLAVQHNLYIAFGPVGGAIEVLAVAMTWVVFVMVRWRKPARTLTLLAAIAVTGALLLWFATVAPMNTVFNGWSAATLPAGWQSYRNQWETGHAVSAVMFAIAFCALVIALLAETPVDAAADRSIENVALRG
jgi:hypothetical protein